MTVTGGTKYKRAVNSERYSMDPQQATLVVARAHLTASRAQARTVFFLVGGLRVDV